MTSTLLNALETLLPAVITLLYAALIGLGVQAAVAGYVRFPRSLGITAGIGLSLTALLMVYSYRLLENPTLPIVPLAVLAVVAIAARLYVESSKKRSGISAVPPRTLRSAVLPGYREIFPVVLTIIIMIPATKYGLTAWTTGVVDFPNYAASADIWKNSSAAFASKHPDAFGALQLDRASHEKPMVTAVLVVISKLSFHPPYRLLSPLFAVFIFISLSSFHSLVRVVFRINDLPAALIISLPTFSVIPLSRIYDAQPGQVAAIALLACLLAILTTSAYRNRLGEKLVLSSVAAVAGAAALGSNLTLVAGSSVMLGAAFLWVFSKKPLPFRKRLDPAIFGVTLTVLLSVPLYNMYYTSFMLQTSGLPGFDIPFAGPLAMIGQQMSLGDVASEKQVLLSWCVVIAAALAVLWAHPSGRFRFPFDLIFLIATTANVLLIGLKLGWSNYSTHKWLAMFIAFAVPLLIAYGTSVLRGKSRIALIMLMFPFAVLSASFGLQYGFGIQYVISDDLLSLRDDEILSSQDSINVRLGDLRENSIAALVMPARTVIITERTYAAASVPSEGLSLVRRDRADAEKYPESILLNESYALIPTFLPLDGDSVAFTTQGSRHFLFGGWHDTEGWGTWSGRGSNYVIFMLPEAYRGGDIMLTITGIAYVPSSMSQTVEIFINDELVATRQYPASDGNTFEIRVPERVLETRGGRVMVDFRVAQPYSPSQFGSADGRALGFGLSQLSISPIQ